VNECKPLVGGSAVFVTGAIGFKAGAYTRPLFSSTSGFSKTKYTLHTPQYPPTTP